MKTIKIKEIDGIQIIERFLTRPVDPEATRKGQALSLITKLPEFIELHKKDKEYDKAIIKSNTEKKNAQIMFDKNNVAMGNAHQERRKQYLDSAKLIQDDMISIKKQLEIKSREKLRENPVYFELRKNEIIKPESEINELESKFRSKTNNQQLKPDGSFVDDFRGVSCHKKSNGKWKKTEIKKIGVKIPVGGKIDDELTDLEKTEIEEQNELSRLAEMTIEEKSNEKQSALDSLLEKSIKMRSGLEIQADPDALTTTQAWYGSEVTKIETKYQ
jgi:hypothetical protein